VIANGVAEAANAWRAGREPRDVTLAGHPRVVADVGRVLNQRQLSLSAALSSGALVICLGSFHRLSRLSPPLSCAQLGGIGNSPWKLSPGFHPAFTPADAASQEKLRALGYAGGDE
jgi:hypothetical protein